MMEVFLSEENEADGTSMPFLFPVFMIVDEERAVKQHCAGGWNGDSACTMVRDKKDRDSWGECFPSASPIKPHLRVLLHRHHTGVILWWSKNAGEINNTTDGLTNA